MRCKGCGKGMWMDEKGNENQDQRRKYGIMNGKWNIRKSGMNGACPQCRAQVEEEK